jgi:presenilin-like A22 family membrane protease
LIDVFEVLSGVFIGATLVGSSVSRTLHVGKGNTARAMWATLCNSGAYFLSTYWVATNNIEAFVGTVVGSLIVVTWMSERERGKGPIRGAQGDS